MGVHHHHPVRVGNLYRAKEISLDYIGKISRSYRTLVATWHVAYWGKVILWMSPFNPPSYRCNVHFIELYDTDRLQSKWSVLSAQPTPCSARTCCSYGWFLYLCVCWCSELCSRSSDDVFCIRLLPILPSCLHPSSLCSACKSACVGSNEILQCLPGHRIAIWERNLVISAIAAGGWLIKTAFNIRCAFLLRATNFSSRSIDSPTFYVQLQWWYGTVENKMRAFAEIDSSGRVCLELRVKFVPCPS